MIKKTLFTAAAVVFLTVAACADEITLKDNQHFQAQVKSFDSYYLVVELPNRKSVSIPWNEVRLVRHTTTESNWLEETYMTQEDAEVTTLVTELNRDEALMKSLFPGFLVHGSGHFYGKDQNTGMSLLSAQILSIVMMAISLNEIISPVELETDSANVSKVIFYTGVTIFGVSWLWDIIFAPVSVDKYNSSHFFLMNEAAVDAVAPQAATGTAESAIQTEEKK